MTAKHDVKDAVTYPVRSTRDSTVAFSLEMPLDHDIFRVWEITVSPIWKVFLIQRYWRKGAW